MFCVKLPIYLKLAGNNKIKVIDDFTFSSLVNLNFLALNGNECIAEYFTDSEKFSKLSEIIKDQCSVNLDSGKT